MKKYILLFMAFCAIGHAFGQYNVTLRVMNAKGKSLTNRTMVSTTTNPSFQTVGREGTLTLSVFPGDTLLLTVDRYMGIIPVTQGGILEVVARRNQMYNAQTKQPYMVVTLPPFNPNDLTKMPGLEGFSSLYSFVSAYYPSVLLRGGEAYLASNISTGAFSGGPRPMLIVLDGTPVASFDQANNLVRPVELKSIVIKRSDPIYGIRGYGGVMEITLKNGRDY